MEFNDNRPIYLQIYDNICEQILTGILKPDERIMSVRDYGAEIGVNPNTVMRSYEKLTSEGIIYNRRGIGYFTCPDAQGLVLQAKRKEFLEKELPDIIRRIEILGLKPEELIVSQPVSGETL